MVKHTRTIRQQPTNCWNVFDHFVGLALKGLKSILIRRNVDESLKNLRVRENNNSKLEIKTL